MANHATKFMSVNLNKSYGQQSHNHSSHSSSYGSNRTRPGSHGGGGGGMVVLSRPRSSQKAGPKLSVPPPLNLPSLRKEHERFDSLGSGGGPAGGGVSGTGSRPTSSGMGWTKPVTVAFPEKEVFPEQTPDASDQGSHAVDGFSRGSNVYMPPSARSGVVGPPASASTQAHPVTEKAAVLRGEDFPSLKATLSSASGSAQKQKEILNQKQKGLESDNLINEQKDGSRLSPLVDMRSQFNQSDGGGGGGSGPSENGDEAHSFTGSRAADHSRKQEEYFPGPLPLVRLNPRSDWADDERDTSHGLTDRSRESRNHGFPKNEAYWDRDFDMPRVSVLPHKPVHNFDKRGQRDDEAGKVSSSEVTKLDPSVRTASTDGRDGNSWRNSSFSKDGLGVQDAGSERNSIGAKPSSMNRELGKDNKYIPSPFRVNVHDDLGKREVGYGQGGKQPWNNAMESYGSRGTERNARDRYGGNEQQNRDRVDSVQSSVPKPSFSVGGKGLPVNDPLLNFGREKRPIAKNEKAFLDDPFMKDFDGRDLFSSGLVGVVKKKKDVVKQADFHDPVRESFEAELERVQRMQEQERQRIIEEQERALELARREEEERLMQVREQEKRQRRLEEEAREAAWRAEQERLENMRKAEEQRLAREEEKQRILLEEERRKQAAKQKLLELEEKIARRRAEASKVGNNSALVGDDKLSGTMKEKQSSRATDVGDWDDSERMVERIITSASSDSSSVNRQLEMGSRPHFPRDVSSTFGGRGKPANSWRRDIYENGSSSTVYLQDQDNGYHSPRRDSSVGGKPFIRKDYYGNAGFMSSRTYYKAGISEPHLDEYAHVKGQKWNQSGDGDNFSRNTEMDSEFHDNFVERFGDGWAQGRPRGNPFSPYPERPYPSSELDGPYAFGRSRYSVRQPRVLPPPSLASVHKTFRNDNEHPGPAAFLESEVQYDHGARSESTMPTGYDSVHQVNHGQPEVVDALQENTEIGDPKVENNAALRCASQSSLCVSSPPSSPTHLSHDDLDESGDSPVTSSSGEGKIGPLAVSGNESVILPVRSGNENVITSCAVSTGDDDDEWTTENNEHFQEQEEYDEDEDYQEEDEVHEDNVDLNQEFDDMHLEEKELPHMMDNLVLGFDEGVQVRMPNEDFEKTSKNGDTAFVSQQVSSGTLEEHASFDNARIDVKALQSVNDSSQVNLSSSSSVFHETKNQSQDLAIQTNSHSSIASESLEDVEASNSGLSAHHTIPTSVTTNSHASSGQTVMSNVAAAPSQSELPIKLQFGLFSGPSLIPSPVPAIQIGSIQMPLHLHPQLGAPLSHMHPPQPPLFQFGQLRYTSPISQGVMPLAPQSMSFVQPNIPSGFTFNHNHGGPMSVQAGQDGSDGFIKSEARSHSMDNQSSNSRQLDLSQGTLSSENAENMGGIKQGQIGVLHDGSDNTRSASGFQSDGQGHPNLVAKNRNNSSNTRDLEGPSQTRDVSQQSVSKEMDFIESKVQFPVTGGRGKRYVFAVKTSGSRSSVPAPRVNRSDSTGFPRRPRQNIQRTEFRVRESADKRQSSGLYSSDQSRGEKLNNNGRGTAVYARTGPRKGLPNKVVKQTVESEGLISASDKTQEIDSGSRAEKADGKQSSTKTQSISHSGQSNLKRNLCSEEDADAPLQSGIIRVFEQPGIEAPSDEDDFIEVRSKRQMLNDRREQREKEIKAKSRVAKMPRKPHSTSQSAKALANSGKSSRSDFVAPDGHGIAKVEVSSGFNASIVSQPLAPIGTPPLKIDAQGDLRSQTSRSHQTSLPAVSSGGKSPRPGVIFETKNKVLDNVQASFGSWDNAGISQQVMALTQTQLDEAMKPQQFDPRASLADLTSAVSEPSLPTSSMFSKEKPFSSAGSPINSLLAGEKIQFGAVTSPTVLPPSSHDAVSHGIGPPRTSRSDIPISHNLAGSDNDCSLFFDKEKHSNESRGHLEDCEAEAEAEAAASAVAVAAISSDEVVGNGLGTCSVTVSDAKSFGAADINGIAAGVVSDQQSVGQSRSEEPLSVSLPADLSVETPPISLWPPLPSPQNSSSQMLSHFPGGPPSHFPFYEMNPMMGGPVFAFGSHDESASTAQSQPQKSNASVSGPIGNWQQCHSGVDSFYGPPTGFTGPFITPPGGIPGVQGPPHMVVYNHFAPVGQFGQVGLSFMGTTYIPSGKQPDWKHNPTSSAMVAGEGDMNNMMMASSQRNPANMSTPIQHLAPGSPLLPMASPLAMFDVSPFQSSPEMPVQARWPHVPTSALSSVPLSMPLQQQAAGAHTSQFPSVDQTLSVNRFPSPRTSTSSDADRKFSTAADVNVNQLPDELGLVDPSSSTAAKASSQGVVNKNSSLTTVADSAKGDATVQNVNGSTGSSQSSSSAYKSQPSQQSNISTQQYDHSSGYTNYQRGGGVSHKSGSGGEWSHRRMGFQGRNQSLGGDKSFSSSKVKQIYVAKQTGGGPSSTVS